MSESSQLVRFFKDWQAAAQRVQMAQQTLAAAQNDAALKEARFKGAAELLYGADATYSYDERGGLTFTRPNRSARRALAKGKKS